MNDFDSREVLAAAIAVHELNNNQYLKETKRDYDLDGDVSKNTWANKDILKAHYGIDFYSQDAAKPPKIVVEEKHLHKADDIKKFTAKSIFSLIRKGDGSKSYEEQVYVTVNKDKVSKNELGIIASVPYYYDNAMKRKSLSDRLDSLDSQWIGSKGDKVFLTNMEIVKKRFSINYNMSIVHGICDNNLFMFFLNRDNPNIEEGKVVSISARVKDHILENDKYKMNRLSYVTEMKK